MPVNSTGSNEFQGITIGQLQDSSADQLDELPFGVIGLSAEGYVEVYNTTESVLAGLPKESVIGLPYFLNVAQCMNNYLVAQRLQDEPELDTCIDYVLTLRMRPTPVRLRLLRTPSAARRFILIERYT